MTKFGYPLMTEQSGPRELVRDAWRSEYVELRAEVRPLPGAADLVHQLAGDGFVVALYDVESAARAGIGCVAVRTGGFGRAELEEAGAQRVEELATDLLELDWTKELSR